MSSGRAAKNSPSTSSFCLSAHWAAYGNAGAYALTYDHLVLRVASTAGVVVAAAVVGIAAAGPSAGANRVVHFGDLPRGWVPGIPRDVRSASRIVGQLDGHTIAAAPTRNGNYCEAFWVKTRHHGWSGCRVRSAFGPDHGKDFHSDLIGGTFSVNRRSVLSVSGSTAAGAKPRLYVVYRDGVRERLTVIWVGKPIRAGFFYRTIPSGHLAPSRRAKSLELRDGSRLVARQMIPLPRPR
jgi:hypothetical protein